MKLSTQHFVAFGLLLTGIATQLTSIQHWDEATNPQFVAGMLLMIGSVITGMFSRNPSTQPGKPLERKTRHPKVPLVVLLLVAMFGAACAGAARTNRTATVALVTAESEMHTALGQARERINQICVPNVLVDTCRTVRLAFADVLDHAAAFTRAILEQRWSAFVDFVTNVNAAVREASKLPFSELRTRLIADLQRAVPAFAPGGQK